VYFNVNLKLLTKSMNYVVHSCLTVDLGQIPVFTKADFFL